MKSINFFTITKTGVLRIFSVTLLALLIVFLNAVYFSNLTFSNYADTNADANAGSFKSGKLAIIIDDFGQNRNGVQEMMSINKHLTFAVMPFLEFTQIDAKEAHKNGFEVIVHLPMESNMGKLSWVGPRPILSAMSDQEVYQIVMDSFESVPYALGANIHMGAKAGEDERIINDVLDVIKIKGLYFVDSRSCRHPIVKKIADEKGVFCFDRDFFLDGEKPKSYIIDQLSKAGDMALKKGFAVAIGHVGTEGGAITAEAINEMLPEFEKRNIQLVFVSELVKNNGY